VSFLEFSKITTYRRAGAVRRYHTETLLRPETVAEHSANVAFLCSILDPECATALIYSALIHDTAEIYTGDIPYPFKKQHADMGKYVNAVEKGFLLNHGLYVELTEEQVQVLKAADMLDLVLKCLEEARLGNRTLENVYRTGIAVLATLQLPPVVRAKLDSIVEQLGASSQQEI
jgi:5'-deoxynucleotidase YfbR-like HD superfamily hydrolase